MERIIMILIIIISHDKKAFIAPVLSFLRNEELKVLNDSGKENSSLKRIKCSILILSLMAKGKIQCDTVML